LNSFRSSDRCCDLDRRNTENCSKIRVSHDLIVSVVLILFSQYVRLSHDTDADRVLDLLLKRWGLEVPNLVISVTGGAKSFVLKPRLKEVFRRGLVKAAKTTGAWIITGDVL